MVTYTSYSKLFSSAFFEITRSDCFAQVTEVQTGQEKAKAIKRKLNAL